MDKNALILELMTDFNKKIDENRRALRGRFRGEADDITVELMNRMEIARRVFNHFMATGEVKIPD